MFFEDCLSWGWSASSTCGLQTNHGLEWVVDPPLQTCEGTDHDDSRDETRPESGKSDLAVDFADLLADGSSLLSLTIQLADHGIGWVRDDGAEDTGEVSGHESNTELSALGVIFLSLGEVISIEVSNEPFESDELDNCVGNLAAPKWTNTLVESVGSWIEL